MSSGTYPDPILICLILVTLWIVNTQPISYNTHKINKFSVERLVHQDTIELRTNGDLILLPLIIYIDSESFYSHPIRITKQYLIGYRLSIGAVLDRYNYTDPSVHIILLKQ